MEWVKLSSSYYLSRKVMCLPDADAEVMFLRGMAYCGDAETGGFIPDQALLGLGRRKHRQSAAALVMAGLWEAAPFGYVVVNWHEWQEELERLVARKKKDAERKRQERAASRGLSVDASVDSPSNVRGERREEEKTPPLPPQAGGFRSACQVHKARRKAACLDCQRPAPTLPASTPLTDLCSLHGRDKSTCPWCPQLPLEVT